MSEPAIEQVALHDIRTDGGTQARAGLNDETVAEYAAAIEANDAMPPVVVFYDGETYWLADGFHRVAARARVGRLTVKADVRQGTRRDAVLHACGANATHGLKRSNADKRRAVETLLRDDDWRAWSDNEIARRCAVTQPFVSKFRAELAGNNGYTLPEKRRGADGKEYALPKRSHVSAEPVESPPTESFDAPAADDVPSFDRSPVPDDDDGAPPLIHFSAPPHAPEPPPAIEEPAPVGPWWSTAASLCAALDADLRRFEREYAARIAAFVTEYERAVTTRTGITEHAIGNLRKPRLLGAEDVARLWPVGDCDCGGTLAHRCTRCRGAGFVSRATSEAR